MVVHRHRFTAVRRSRTWASNTATPAPIPIRWSIWEGQFGDFANGAQVVIDQFISSGEAKWGRLCGHDACSCRTATKGQGPEHSSARLERFLQLCAELNNIRSVCRHHTGPDVPHAARQMVRDLRKPLVVMTPKSLLRHKPGQYRRSGDLDRRPFPGGSFPRSTISAREKVERIVFCSGKVYYDLLEAREANRHRTRVAIVRIEQLYPFPDSPSMPVDCDIIRTSRKSCGARKSRRTRAPGTRSSTASRIPLSPSASPVLRRPPASQQRRHAGIFKVTRSKQQHAWCPTPCAARGIELSQRT